MKKLSEQVFQIIKKATDSCKEQKLQYVTFTEVVKQTFEYIKNSGFPAPFQYLFSGNIVFEEVFNMIVEENESNNEDFITKKSPFEGETILDPTTDEVIRRAENFSKSNFIELVDFVRAILSSDDELIEDLNDEYGLNLDLFNSILYQTNNSTVNQDVQKAANFLGKILGENENPIDALNKLFNKPNKEQDKMDEQNFEKFGQSESISSKELDPNSDTPFLDQFSEDMTKKAKDNQYDPVIGREDVIDNIAEILCKRKKANVALVGVAGSGKSSTVERLAQRISKGQVPEKLKDKRLCSLNLNDLVAGTKYRGEYEERLQKIIKEVCSSKNIIIYIDELHNLVGSGSTSGNGDGANILKPYLARGEFQCIGSTTNEEYRKFIEKDPALNRRFTQVEITEPTNEETIKILNGIKTSYEKFHHVRFEKDVIDSIVEWSSRYITDKHQPDKAIDILDLSGSLASIKFMENNKNDNNPELNALTEKVVEVKKFKETACLDEKDFEKAENLHKEEIDLQTQIDKINKANQVLTNSRKNWVAVTIEDVAQSVGKVSKVPIDKINQTDRERLVNMRAELTKKVVGQDKAIEVVVKNLQRSWLGLRQPKKPIFTGLFVGNTGTGKTLICKEIAKIFFGSEKNLIRIDCGELRDKASVSKLTGTTAGYVGYDDEPLLLQVKRIPNCILLLDEIDKCDPSIYEIFMNILDEGYCILGDGTRVDFTNSVIIFTGNVGTKELRSSGRHLGFNNNANQQHQVENIVMKSVEKTFKPEFINRLSSIVVFNELGKAEMGKIFALELDTIKKQLSKRKLSLKVTAKMKENIINLVNLSYGARDLKRLIDIWVVDPVSEAMLDKAEATKFTVEYNPEKNIPEVISE